MKTKISRLASLFFAAFICLCTIAVPAFAVESVGGGVATNGSGGSSFSSQNKASGHYGTVASPNEILGQNGDVVTVDDATDWVDRKGGEVVSLMVHAVKPVCVIGIFAGVLMCIFGAIGNKKLLVGGLIAIGLCAVLFTAVTCWPEILSNFSSWLMS